MSNTWIGTIKLTNEDAVYGSDGEKILDYNHCDGSEVDAEKFPILAEKGLHAVNVSSAGISHTITSSTRGSVTDGEYYYILSASGRVTQYTTEWIPTGVTYSVSGQTSKTSALCWDGLHFWVIAETNKVLYKYDAEFIYTGLSYGLSSLPDYPQGMLYDGTHYWISAKSGLYQYDSSMSPTGVSYTLEGAGGAGVVIYGGFFWIQDYREDTIYQYTLTGTYTGTSIYSGSLSSLAFSLHMHHSGGGFYLCGFSGGSRAHRYEGDVILPLMDAPAGSPNPYKIISDLYWYQIGDTIRTGSDKIRGQSGDYEFDALLNDGSAVDQLTHPQLYAIMQTLPNDPQPAHPNQPFKTVADLTED